MEEFKIGDVVKLKSGSPKMTIETLKTEENYAYCVWIEDGKKRDGEFDTRTLKKVVPKKKPDLGSI